MRKKKDRRALRRRSRTGRARLGDFEPPALPPEEGGGLGTRRRTEGRARCRARPIRALVVFKVPSGGPGSRRPAGLGVSPAAAAVLSPPPGPGLPWHLWEPGRVVRGRAKRAGKTQRRPAEEPGPD